MTPPPRPPASLSLDLDNLWSYLKIHGDPGWEAFPSYLDLVIPRVVEIPVTTMPILRTPIHLSYLLYLDLVAPALGSLYFGTALRLCRLAGVDPSILLHPLDFLGCDDTGALSFFPGMRRPGAWKLERVSAHLAALAKRFEVVPMGERLERSARLRELAPAF